MKSYLKKYHYLLLLIVLCSAFHNCYSQLTFEIEEYSNRREKLMDLIPDGIAIIRGASDPLGNGHFSQYNNIMYFAGTEIPDLILVIDGVKRESTLFFSIDEKKADSENIPLSLIREPVKTSGIENYQPYEEFTPYLENRVEKGIVIYTPFSPEEYIAECTGEKLGKFRRSVTENEWDGRLTRELQFVKKLREKFPDSVIEDCSPDIWKLRKIKSEAEIDILREAARIGVRAHKAVMLATKTGVPEVKLAALFEYECMKERAKGLAFSTIIMSAEHHAYGHYAQYDRNLENGDFIILDAGPDFEYYDADISTTFPANGKFSEKQKELYELGLKVRETCINNYRAGISLSDVGREVAKMLEKNGYDSSERRFSRFIKYGGYNHSIGMAVHDKMDEFSTDELLKPGFVFACDIMAKTDEVTSIRIEDTVVITEDGCEILSTGLPRTVKEIESFMQNNKITDCQYQMVEGRKTILSEVNH